MSAVRARIETIALAMISLQISACASASGAAGGGVFIPDPHATPQELYKKSVAILASASAMTVEVVVGAERTQLVLRGHDEISQWTDGHLTPPPDGSTVDTEAGVLVLFDSGHVGNPCESQWQMDIDAKQGFPVQFSPPATNVGKCGGDSPVYLFSSIQLGHLALGSPPPQ